MKTLLANSTAATDPFLRILRDDEFASILSIELHSLEKAEWMLLENLCDVALVSPLAFAKKQTEFVFLSGASVSIVGRTDELLLVFRSGLKSVASVAVLCEHEIDSILTQIILQEKFGITAKFQRTRGTIAELLTAHDAVLVRRDELVEDVPKESIDIYDEWFDLFQLPFVRNLVVGWKHRVTAQLNATIAAAGKRTDVQSLLRLEEKMKTRLIMNERDSIVGHYRYTWNEDMMDGMQTFFRLAFYYGLHRDVPTLLPWEEEESLFPDLDTGSSNQ